MNERTTIGKWSKTHKKRARREKEYLDTISKRNRKK